MTGEWAAKRRHRKRRQRKATKQKRAPERRDTGAAEAGSGGGGGGSEVQTVGGTHKPDKTGEAASERRKEREARQMRHTLNWAFKWGLVVLR